MSFYITANRLRNCFCLQKTKSDQYKKQLNTKISKLESLCRALQEERRKNASPNGAEVQGSDECWCSVQLFAS